MYSDKVKVEHTAWDRHCQLLLHRNVELVGKCVKFGQTDISKHHCHSREKLIVSEAKKVRIKIRYDKSGTDPENFFILP